LKLTRYIDIDSFMRAMPSVAESRKWHRSTLKKQDYTQKNVYKILL